MLTERLPLEPILSTRRVRFLSDEQLDDLQAATLEILERVGVRFPSEAALRVFEEHGASVDRETQVVRLTPDLVMRAMASVPRYFTLAARDPALDLALQDGVSWFTLDGCGMETIDAETGLPRPSTKADVAAAARVADYLPSIGFVWTTVSARDRGLTSPLHDLEACWGATTKHVQSVTLMGAAQCRYALDMATVLTGSREELRRRPNFSLVVCTVSPLLQDHVAIEGALVLAEAGIPVVLLSMPTLGTTAPATKAGALAMADAEIVSAAVLLQLAHPGAPVFHSTMQAWADPRTAAYVGYPLDARARYAPVEMAHHWGMPSLAACYGTDSPRPGTWQSAAEVALDPFLAGLVSPEIVTGLGLVRTYTLLYPEAIILDDDIYQRARYALLDMDVSPETLAVDVIANVGPAGHFLAEKHTRTYMRDAMVRGLTHELAAPGGYRDPVEVAREKVSRILETHHPEPLEPAKQAELTRILAAADRELA